MQLEQRLAEAFATKTVLRDPIRSYNKLNIQARDNPGVTPVIVHHCGTNRVQGWLWCDVGDGVHSLFRCKLHFCICVWAFFLHVCMCILCTSRSSPASQILLGVSVNVPYAERIRVRINTLTPPPDRMICKRITGRISIGLVRWCLLSHSACIYARPLNYVHDTSA